MEFSSLAAKFALILPLTLPVDGDVFAKDSPASTAAAPDLMLAMVQNPYTTMTLPAFRAEDDNVTNPQQWHAFVLVGTDTLFASHITNLFMEVHKYHLIIEISLPEPYRSKFIEERKRHPDDSFFLANLFQDDSIGSGSDPMNLPELAAGLRTSFKANVWHGVPNKPVYDDWPWRGVRPILSNVEVSIKRVVYFEPFSGSMNHPERLTYLLFGSGTEAHMVHLQTMHCSLPTSNPPPKCDPDYDHVASLKETPSWLAADLLKAGVVIDLPDKSRFGNDEDKARGVRCAAPFENGSETEVRYRGADFSGVTNGVPIGPSPIRRIMISNNKWFCTRIANKPDPCQAVNERACGSNTPKKYLAP